MGDKKEFKVSDWNIPYILTGYTWHCLSGNKVRLFLKMYKNHVPTGQLNTGPNLSQKKYLVGGWGGSGGYQALFRFELPACYDSNLGIFWGVWLFQKKFLSTKKTTLVKSLFENTMGNPFFEFLNMDQKK